MLLYHYSIGNMKYRSTILKHFLANDILIQFSSKIKFSGTMYRCTDLNAGSIILLVLVSTKQ